MLRTVGKGLISILLISLLIWFVITLYEQSEKTEQRVKLERQANEVIQLIINEHYEVMSSLLFEESLESMKSYITDIEEIEFTYAVFIKNIFASDDRFKGMDGSYHYLSTDRFNTLYIQDELDGYDCIFVTYNGKQVFTIMSVNGIR